MWVLKAGRSRKVSNKYISVVMQVILYLWVVFMTLWLTVVVVSASNHLVTLGFIGIGVIVGYPLYRASKYFWNKDAT